MTGEWDDLTFSEFREANERRCALWHPGFPNDGHFRAPIPRHGLWSLVRQAFRPLVARRGERSPQWTASDWSNAMAGEAGETCNVVKKLRRIETDMPGALDPEYEQLVAMLADEIADTFCYLDLLAAYFGIDLGEAVVSKFNRISQRENLPVRIER